jgi:hypothetical protein
MAQSPPPLSLAQEQLWFPNGKDRK